MLAFAVGAFLAIVSRSEVTGIASFALLLFALAIPLSGAAIMVSLVSRQYSYTIYPWYRAIVDFGPLVLVPFGVALLLGEYSLWHVAAFVMATAFSLAAIFLFSAEIRHALLPKKTNK